MLRPERICPCCGYDLSGLPDPLNTVCPECGADADTRAAAMKVWQERRDLKPILLIALLLISGSLLTGVCLHPFGGAIAIFGVALTPGLLFGCGALAHLLTIWLFTPPRPGPSRFGEGQGGTHWLMRHACGLIVFVVAVAGCAATLITIALMLYAPRI